MSVEVTGMAAVGDVLAGKYRVDKILGIGGMGMVVAAKHLEIDQRVALKFMLPGSHESPETAARFLREARAAGRLNSDHVCRVMDVGRFDNGVPYIVMEYLQGEDLAAVLRRRGPLRVAEAVDYILQGIEGLAEAHAHGIIHRDLKPENLFLHKRNDGGLIVKVLDFGISKIAVAGASTKTGDIMGSPAYMAPEQMDSSTHVDHRADLWSLGVVLYQLVAGKPPFRGDTLPLLCMHVVNDDPPPMSAVRADLPDGFEAVVMKCLQKEPVDRYRDVGELARALAPFGPKNATTSASRIQIVLARPRGSAATISHEFSTITPPDGNAMAPPAKREPQATTFTSTVGQSISQVRADRPSWGLPAALIAGLGLVALVVVVLWRSEGIGDVPGDEPSQSMLAKPPLRPPPPIVEPIIEEPAATPDRPAVDPAVVPTVDHAVAPGADHGPTADHAVAPGTDHASTADHTVAPGPGADHAPTADHTVAPGTDHGPAADRAVAPGSGADHAPTADHRPVPDRKKRKPHRPSGRGTPRAGSGSAAGPGSGADEGSAAPPDPEEDDEKWMHMTHDEKQP